MARLDLRQVRRIRAHYGATVNDVLLAVTEGLAGMARRPWRSRRRSAALPDVQRLAEAMQSAVVIVIDLVERARQAAGTTRVNSSDALCPATLGR
jgi:hypothetical protein